VIQVSCIFFKKNFFSIIIKFARGVFLVCVKSLVLVVNCSQLTINKPKLNKDILC
jgi:hypothetical protein